MKLSLEGASEMLRPEKKWANYSKDSSNNEQEPLIKMNITWNSLIISFVSLWLPLSVSNAFEEKKEMLCLLIRD